MSTHTEKKRFRLVEFSTIMQEPIPEPDWLVEPLIGKGDCTLLYGEWGTYKSWLLMHLGLHLAAGLPWLDSYQVQSPQSVLYVDGEMNENIFRQRTHMLARGAEVDGHALPFWLLSKPAITFDGQGATALLKFLEEEGFDPDVIIVETFRRFMNGNENEAADVGGFWRNVRPLLEENRTLILSHHMKKPNTKGQVDIRDRASGSTDIMAGLDSALAIEKVKKHSKTVRLHHTKSRWGEEVEPVLVQFEGETGGKVATLSLAEQDLAEQALSLKEHALRELEIWHLWHYKPTVTSREAKQVLRGAGISERTADRYFREYCQKNNWQEIKKGTYRVPPLPKIFQDEVA